MKKNEPHPLKGRKWTPEQKAKAAATRAARIGVNNLTLDQVTKLQKQGHNPVAAPAEERIKDAIVYLRHANRAVDRSLEKCLLELAIHTLRGTV
jgi:hypothetical protein